MSNATNARVVGTVAVGHESGIVTIPQPQQDQVDFLSALHKQTAVFDASAVICGPRKTK